MKKIILVISFISMCSGFFAQSANYRLLVGTYTNTGKSEGIYTYDIDLEKSVFVPKYIAKGISNPSYLALTNDKKFVYSVSESGVSALSAFSFDVASGKLQLINTEKTESPGPCFVTVSDKHVFSANYSGGSVSVFGRQKDGPLTPLKQLINHSGSSITAKRQNAPHAHQVIFTPDKKYLLVNDLGTDKVMVYAYLPNYSTGSVSKPQPENKVNTDEVIVSTKLPRKPLNILTPYDGITVKAGSGPRHLTISKNGNYVYLLQELDGTVSVFGLKNGKLTLKQETTVVHKSDIETGAADIHLSPDGKFLYATNRGTANDISCFSVGKDGKISFEQQVSTEGIGPRNFAITPDGNYLFVGNQRSDYIVIFKRDKKTGLLSDTGKRIEVGAPVCLLFY